MGAEKLKTQEIKYYNISSFSLKYKTIISIIFGILCLFLSPYSLNTQIEDITINIPWSILFPIIISMAFGWRYALIASFSGAAFYPFFLWPEDGLSNLLTSIIYLSFFTSIGIVNGMDYSKGGRFVLYRVILILIAFCISITILYKFLFNPLLSLNSVFKISNTIDHLDDHILNLFVIKDSINFTILTVLADIFLRLSFLRRLLGLPTGETMKYNTQIFGMALFISFLIWIAYIGLTYVLINHNGFRDGHIPLALIVLVTGSFIAAHAIIFYTEKQIFARNALKESEFFFRESQRAANIGSYKTDFLNGSWESSEVLDQIFGIDQNYIRSFQGWLDIVHSDDREMMGRYLAEEVIAKKGLFNKEYRIQRISDGNIRWVLGLGIASFNEEGKILTLIGTIQDITERKLAEEKLKVSEERFKIVAESAEEWIWEVNKDGLYTYSNDIVEPILGYKSDEIVGKMYFYDFFEPEEREQLKNDAFNIFAQRLDFKNFINVNIHKNGQKLILRTSGSPIINNEGILVGYRGADADITKQKQMELDIIESEERYRLTFMTSPDAININRIDGTYVDVNEGFTKLTGFTREDVVGVKSQDINIWHIPEDREKLVKGLTEKGFVENLESVFRFRNGDLRTGLMSAKIVKLKGKPHILSITRDIHERKLLEDALAKSEEKFRMLFEKSNDAIFLINRKTGKYLDANNAAELLSGYSIEEIKMRSTKDLSPDNANERLAIYSNTKETISFGEVEYYRPDGYKRTALLSSIPLNDDEIFGIAHDMTERNKQEEALRALFRAIEQSPVSVIITDIDGSIEYVNPKFSEVSGYAITEVIGVTQRKLYSGNPKELYDNLWNTITSGEEWKGELCNKKKNGEIYWENAIISPITNEKGEVIRFIAVLEDITEKKEAERRILSSIIEAEERERNRFSRDLHDGLGPLLSTVKLYFQWLSEVTDSEKKNTIIEKGEKNLNEAIESIREISNNLSPRTLNSFGAVVALKQFIDNINQTQKLNINFTSNTDKRFERNVEIILYRVSTELINNTLKYANATKSEVSIYYNDKNEQISLVYKDNGKGFNLNEVKSSGRGLGLINIEQRVNTLKGKINIESSIGKGLIVKIDIPVSSS